MHILLAALLASATEIPLRDFFRNAEKGQFRISDDGTWIAYLAPYKNRKNIFVQKIGDKEGTRITDETERDIAGYFWKGNDTLVFVKDFGGDENFHVLRVGRDGKNVKDLTPFPKVKADIVDDLAEQPTALLVSHNKRKPEIFDVYKIDVETGASTLVAENPGNISSWHTDHDGRVRAAVTTDGVNASLLYRADEKEKWKKVLSTTFREGATPQFFSFDNKKLYVASNIKRDKSAIVLLDPETGKEDSVLFEHPEVDVDSLGYSRARKVITCANFTTWRRERKCFDATTQAILDDLAKVLPGMQVDVADANKAEDKLIVATWSDRSNGARYLYDTKSKKLDKLGDLTPWLDATQLSEMKPISYKSRDGLTINGYLTLPNGSTGKNLPLIIHPHGGPWYRDDWGFDPEVQFLANRGYAVLQMNFRGSTGYGKKFWEASFKEWGKKMQDDVSDGVKWAIAQGVADPKRVAIYGASYGGYTTLAGMTFTPELYACGVDYVGVSNIFTWIKAFPPYWKPYLEMVYEMVGHPEKDKANLTAVSPALHVDKIKAPLFIAQGANDPRVKKEESDQIVAALKKRGIDAPYMVKDNEGHGFHNEENRFDFYGEMEKFLAKHLKKT